MRITSASLYLLQKQRKDEEEKHWQVVYYSDIRTYRLMIWGHEDNDSKEEEEQEEERKNVAQSALNNEKQEKQKQENSWAK